MRVLTPEDSSVNGEQAEVAADERLSPHRHEPAGRGEEGAERNRRCAMVPADCDEGKADDGADARGDQDSGEEHLPAEPGTERGKELEVPVPHPFLPGDQPEEMIDAPQAQVTRYRSYQARAQIHRHRASRLQPEKAEEESQPHER